VCTSTIVLIGEARGSIRMKRQTSLYSGELGFLGHFMCQGMTLSKVACNENQTTNDLMKS
jgi:hypothetical protein